MLRPGRMEEFVTEEEEPWYDQRDLEQGEASWVRSVRGGSCDVTMPHPQSLHCGIKGFMLEGVDGKKRGGCIHCKIHNVISCTSTMKAVKSCLCI